MITLPLELEQQIDYLAKIEHIDPIAFLKRMIDDYANRIIKSDDFVYLSGISNTLSEEWDSDADNEAFRDL